MHQSPFEVMKLSQSVDPADLADGATNGSSVDMSGWEGIVAIVTCGALGANGTVDCKLQDSADNASFADIASASITQVADTGDNKVYLLDRWKPPRRYVRPVVTIGGTSVAVVVGCLLLQYRPTGLTPITQHADVGELKKVS